MIANIMYAAVDVLAQMPGQNLTPSAPGNFVEKTNNALNFGYFLAIVCIIVGVITVGASMVLSRRDGTGEEATANAMRVGVGSLIVGGASGIVTYLVGQ